MTPQMPGVGGREAERAVKDVAEDVLFVSYNIFFVKHRSQELQLAYSCRIVTIIFSSSSSSK